MSKRGRNGEMDEELNVGLLAFLQRYSTDAACREYLERKLWPDGPACPHCDGGKPCYPIACKTARAGLYACGACRQQFTVTVGTVFERSHIPLPKWFAAIYLMNASKKGMSAHQLHRQLGVTYKSAWFMCHRVREAMRTPKPRPPLGGRVEADETYVGGKGTKHGRGSEKKTPVLALMARSGKMRARVMERVGSKELKDALLSDVRRDATLYTDEWKGYIKAGREFRGGHETVAHGEGQYAKGDAHVNDAESWFALLKRGIHGTFHHVSRSHLSRYCDEFEFRWNARRTTDGTRTAKALASVKGKRLMYKRLVESA